MIRFLSVFMLLMVAGATNAAAAVDVVATTQDLAALVQEVSRTLAKCAGTVPVIGVHCHDDLGLATANSLAALKAGAHGVLLSRKYSEMNLANIAAAGRAVREMSA